MVGVQWGAKSRNVEDIAENDNFSIETNFSGSCAMYPELSIIAMCGVSVDTWFITEKSRTIQEHVVLGSSVNTAFGITCEDRDGGCMSLQV